MGLIFLHVIITLIGFKITISNMGSFGAPLLISTFNPESEMSPLTGLKFSLTYFTKIKITYQGLKPDQVLSTKITYKYPTK